MLLANKSLLSVKVISLLLFARMIWPVLLQKELYLVPAGVRVVKKIIANKKIQFEFLSIFRVEEI